MYLKIFILLIAFCLLTAAPAVAQDKGIDGKAADGQKVFLSKCASCHGKDGSGDTPTGKRLKVPDLRTLDLGKQTEAQVIERINNVKAHSTIKKSAGEKGIADAAAYLRTEMMKPISRQVQK
jgi:mono/diheme cytochrome c family protein